MSTARTYEGVVQNGLIRLNADVRLPENARVFVVVPDDAEKRPSQIRSPRLVERDRIADFAFSPRFSPQPEMDQAAL